MSREIDAMSASSDSDISDGADWLDVEPDEEQITFVSLFGPETFSSIDDLLRHCKANHGFDLAATVRELKLNFHDAIKLVNFIRCQVEEKKSLPKPLSSQDFADDKYLKPVLENDALLFSLDEILGDENETSQTASVEEPSSLEAKNKDLQAKLEAVTEQFASYRLAVEETLDKRWGDENEQSVSQAKPKQDKPDYYFESYAYNGKPLPCPPLRFYNRLTCIRHS